MQNTCSTSSTCESTQVANAHEAVSRVEAVAKKKLLKLTQRLQQPGLLPEERARLLSKIEGRLEKLDALPSPQPAGEFFFTFGLALEKVLSLDLSRLWVECCLIIPSFEV